MHVFCRTRVCSADPEVYGVRRVILLLDFQKQQFEWADLPQMLQEWQISQNQFVDACLLAGTESKQIAFL